MGKVCRVHPIDLKPGGNEPIWRRFCAPCGRSLHGRPCLLPKAIGEHAAGTLL
jgi:hypothetical protein